MNDEFQKLRKKPHWSFSSLNGFINICSLQWAFKYVYKNEPESVPINLLFGSAFHKAMSWLAIMRMKDFYPKTQEIQDVFSEFWNLDCKAQEELSFSKDEQNLHDKKGRLIVSCLSSSWTEDNIIAVSKLFSVMLPGTNLPLIGEVDVIVEDDNNKHILIDWKTSSSKWPVDKAAKDLQATLYMYAYE